MADELRAGCDLCGDTGRLDLRGRCHPTAPLRAVIDGGRLTLRCYVPECDRVVADWPAELLLPPADEDPADVDWLLEVGGKWSADGTAIVIATNGPEVVCGVLDVRGETSVTSVGLLWCYRGPGVPGTISMSYAIDDNPTRGQVRRLCAALGVELAAAATDGPAPRGDT